MQIGVILQKSWEIFKENPGKLILPYFIFFLISFGSGIVLGIIPVVGALLSSVVNVVFLAGVYYVYLKLYVGRETTIDDMFYPARELLLRLATMALIKTVFIAIGLVLFVIPGIYLAVSYLFSELLMVDKKLDAWEALETSRKAVTKKWFAYFALCVVLLFINVLGLIPFGLGIFVTAPFSLMAIVLAYVAEFYGERMASLIPPSISEELP